MLLVDLEEGRIISDEEVKSEIAGEFPYQEWLSKELVHVSTTLRKPKKNLCLIC